MKKIRKLLSWKRLCQKKNNYILYVNYFNILKNMSINFLEPDDALKFINENKQNPNFVMLDIRKKRNYKKSRIDQAMSLPYDDDDFDNKLKKMDRKKIYLVYCASDSISNIVVETMVDLSFDNISKIAGGISRWYKLGLEIITAKR